MALELGWERFPGFARSALEALTGYPWPGNVRELKNVVERAVYRAASPRRPIAELAFDPFASPFRPQAAPRIDRTSSCPAAADRSTSAPRSGASSGGCSSARWPPAATISARPRPSSA